MPKSNKRGGTEITETDSSFDGDVSQSFDVSYVEDELNDIHAEGTCDFDFSQRCLSHDDILRNS